MPGAGFCSENLDNSHCIVYVFRGKVTVFLGYHSMGCMEMLCHLESPTILEHKDGGFRLQRFLVLQKRH